MTVMDTTKPLSEATDEELTERRRRLREVQREMVGTLYPSIAEAQIAGIDRELLNRRVKRVTAT